MSDFDMVSLEAAEAVEAVEAMPVPAVRMSGRMAEATSFAGGLLLTLAVMVVGTLVLTAALVVGVVGAPLLAAGAAWLLVRHVRTARQARRTAWKPAA